MPKNSIVREIYRKRERRAILVWKLSLFVGLVFFSLIVCYPKMRRIEELESTCAFLQHDIEKETRTNEELTQRRDRLMHDPEAIEELAKSVLEVRRPGERVYRLIQEGKVLVQKGGGELD